MSRNNLSDKIAALIDAETAPDLSGIAAGIEKINNRLDKIEARIFTDSAIPEPQNTLHSSAQKFAIAEAIVDGLFAAEKDKACAFEPNARPCDHCSMCSSRGF